VYKVNKGKYGSVDLAGTKLWIAGDLGDDLGDGETEWAEVTFDPVKYFAAPRNDGFVLMPNEVQAYRGGDKQFEYKGTNGFMLTLDINSTDVK
jgi:hypothetical protein